MTLVLTRRDIQRLMSQRDWLAAVEEGFCAAGEGRAWAPAPMHLPAQGGAFHAKGATIRSQQHHAVLKFNGNFPDNPSLRGLPTIQGAILLCDAEDGRLLAILDSIEVTLQRTAAATALAARYLARPDSGTVLICGCGVQSRAQLEALRGVLPIKLCLAWDMDPGKAEALAAEGLEVRPVARLAEAALRSDVIITCTTADKPFLEEAHVRHGTFVAAVGADSPTKSEIAPTLMARARIVVDSIEQCSQMGDLHHALKAGTVVASDIHGELSQLVTGERRGRETDDEIFLFDSTGTALQDATSAAAIYERAIIRGGFASIMLGE